MVEAGSRLRVEAETDLGSSSRRGGEWRLASPLFTRRLLYDAERDEQVTPPLTVESIEPCLLFWVECLGFAQTVDRIIWKFAGVRRLRRMEQMQE